MTSNSRVPRESEAALIIRSENPRAVARQVAGLTSIAGYRLLPRGSMAIHDVYFDTLNHALQTQELALRVREIGAAHWITLKGQSQPSSWGGVNRLEIEVPWSQNALTRVVKELVGRGIKMPQQRQDFDRTQPLEVMTSLGLEVIQERETHRQARDIVSAGEESRLLAELAIDSVVYRFGDQQIHHHEVEIEVKAEGVFAAIDTVIETLVTICGPALRRWDHSKLTTGKAIEKMLGEGALQGLLDANSNLKPAAYDRIDDYLKHSGI
ncbi:MAG: CYTH domain-containing protein [Anaerolineae bacterium]